jgi:hypothetical protein
VDLIRSVVSDSLGTPAGIVAEFDVAGNIAAGMFSGGIFGAMDTLVLQRGKEGSGHGVVIADPRAANGLPNIELAERVGEVPDV